MLFDSHCHLSSAELAPQFDAVLGRAVDAGVSHCLNVSDSLDNARHVIEQAEESALSGCQVWATAGVHPQQALTYCFETSSDLLRDLCSRQVVRGIGEIGLDAVYDDRHPRYPGASMELQERVLRDQLAVAGELALPVVLHNREADAALLHVIEESSLCAGGVFHCFGSSLEFARRVLDLGFHLGFTGIVTFKNGSLAREAARYCPLDRLLIETDSPYLAPVPYRGKTNEPSYLARVAQSVADLRSLSYESLAEITAANAKALFTPRP